jgi:putative transcriptional regulator
MRKSNRPKIKVPTVGARLIAGLTEFVDALESGEALENRLTVRAVEIPEPRSFDAKAVKALRTKVGASQAVFARMLGVSAVWVQSWEQGKRHPTKLACRLLETIDGNPKPWLDMVHPREKVA